MTGLKKNLGCSTDEKRLLVARSHRGIAIYRQCKLIGLALSSYYYRTKRSDKDDHAVMRMIDAQYTKTPFYGIRRITIALKRSGCIVNHKRIARLMRIMGLEAIYPKPRLRLENKAHKVYPYLLQKLNIGRPDQVWCSDITYIPLRYGFAYLVAVMDWFSRYVLAWELSMSLDSGFCVAALQAALAISQPDIFNTDQGSQFTSEAFTGELLGREIQVSMDGRGRAFDNIMIERLWRTVKYEDVYLKDYAHFFLARENLADYFEFYNEERRHSSLGKQPPAAVYWADRVPEQRVG